MPAVCPIQGWRDEPSRATVAHVTGDDPVGFSLDIDKILRDVGVGTRRRRRPATNDTDAAIRRAVRSELVDIERALKTIAQEIVRLRRANEALAEKVGKLTRR
jgi:hypothetical protein